MDTNSDESGLDAERSQYFHFSSSGFKVVADSSDAETLFQAPAADEIMHQSLEIMHMLLDKNISYGNSATAPKQLFSKSSSTERLLSRIDEKINRMVNGLSYPGDDDLLDLIGYLILLRIVLSQEK